MTHTSTSSTPKTNKHRGYDIVLVNGVWLYADTMRPVAEGWKKRPCGHCGLPNTPEGHDGCLGTIPGAINACCGHGDPEQAYVQYAPADAACPGE